MDLQTLCEWQLLSELIYFPIDTQRIYLLVSFMLHSNEL